jgi:aryl-alcohol dehydrogenase-like predicted oxidoreductase
VGVSTQLPEVFEFIDWGEFDVLQFPCSAVQQKHRPAMERAAAAGTGVIARGAASWGGPRSDAAKSWVRELWELARLDELLEDMAPPELLLRCTLCHPDAHTNLFGSADPEHVRANAAAAERSPLPEDLRLEIERRLEAAREAVRRAAPPLPGH